MYVSSRYYNTSWHCFDADFDCLLYMLPHVKMSTTIMRSMSLARQGSGHQRELPLVPFINYMFSHRMCLEPCSRKSEKSRVPAVACLPARPQSCMVEPCIYTTHNCAFEDTSAEGTIAYVWC